MSNVIDLTEVLRRKKLVRFLTEGIPLDLSPELTEEFKFRLEHALTEMGLFTKHNFENGGYEVDEVEIYDNELQEEEHRLMTLAFIDNVLTFLMPDDVIIGSERFKLFGRVAIRVINAWEEFEDLIKFIAQELD